MLVKKLVLLLIMLLLFLISGCGSGELYDPGEVAVTGGRDGRVKVWDLKSGEVKHNLDLDQGSINSVNFFLAGEKILAAGNKAGVWNLEKEELIAEFDRHEGSVRTSALFPCGSKAVTASSAGNGGGTIMIWDLETVELINEVETENLVYQMDVSVCGEKYLYPAAGSVTVRDFSGEIITEFEGHQGSVTEWAAAFSPAGDRAISGSRDNVVIIWDSDSGEILQEFNEHESTIRAVSISPCGKKAATGDYGAVIHVWNVETGEVVNSFNKHEGRIDTIEFSPCGEKILSHDAPDAELDKINPLVWDLGSGEVLLEFDEHADCVLSAEIFR